MRENCKWYNISVNLNSKSKDPEVVSVEPIESDIKAVEDCGTLSLFFFSSTKSTVNLSILETDSETITGNFNALINVEDYNEFMQKLMSCGKKIYLSCC